MLTLACPLGMAPVLSARRGSAPSRVAHAVLPAALSRPGSASRPRPQIRSVVAAGPVPVRAARATESGYDSSGLVYRDTRQYDFVVIGTGIAGLSYAIEVAKHGRVAVISKEDVSEGSTKYAQGGICAVLDQHDTVDKHVQDTMVAGAFLNDTT